MFAFIQIIIAICPVVPLVCLCGFLSTLNEKVYITENVSFKGIKDFFPKNIRQKLERDSGIEKNFSDEALKDYRKLILAFCVYVLFWILYLIGIVVRIVWLSNNYKLLEPQKQGYVIDSILMSILILYWLFLTPIFEQFHWKKLSQLGYITWEFFQGAINIIVERLKQIIKYICELLVSFVPMYIYIILVKQILVFAEIELTFWRALQILMLYQYVLLKLVSNIVKRIIAFITKKIHRLSCLEQYVKDEIIYLFLKNCTYLSMVCIYAVSVDKEKSGTPLAGAICVLFLIDTFLAQENAIQEKIKKK